MAVKKKSVQPKDRPPKQARSIETWNRVLDVAERFLRDRGQDDFTIQEISVESGISIGSLYFRVANRDELIHLVQERVLARLEPEESGLRGLPRAGATLQETVALAIPSLAEFLRVNAGILRAFMLRGISDPKVSAAGKASHSQMMSSFSRVLLSHRDEIGHPDPEHAVKAMGNLVYGALARYLGLGALASSQDELDWEAMKADLVRVTILFLREA